MNIFLVFLIKQEVYYKFYVFDENYTSDIIILLMISMNEGSFQIPEVKSAVLCVKQLSFAQKENSQNSYFLMSTLDKKLILVEINSKHNNLEFRKYIQETENVVTTFHLDYFNSFAYLGYLNGEIGGLEIAWNYLGDVQNFYSLQNPHNDNSVVLIYKRAENLFIWNLSNEVLIVQITTKRLINKFKFKQNISSGISFKSQYSKYPVGCISFDQGFPPIIFDCETEEKFKLTMENSISIHKSQQFHQKEIITMCDNIHIEEDEIYIICGVKGLQQNCISVYSLQKDRTNSIIYLQPVYKFSVPHIILHLSHKYGIVLATMYNSILFFDLIGRKKQIIIQKSDLRVTWGFILGRRNSYLKFVINKGFNYWKPQHYQQKGLKLRIRQKDSEKKAQ